MRMHLLVVLLLILSPVRAFAETLADRVPEDVVAFFQWRGADALNTQYQGSHLQGIAKAANLGPLFSETLPKLLAKGTGNNPQAQEAAQIGLDIAAIVWKHPGAYCVGPVDFSKPNDPQPEIVVICDAGEDASRLLDLTKKAILTGGTPPPSSPPVNVHADGQRVIFTIGKVPAGHAIYFGTSKEGSTVAVKPLATSTRYIQALSQMQATDSAAMISYVDIAGLVKMIDTASVIAPDPSFRSQWPKVRDALNLNTFSTAVFSGGFSGKDWSQQAFIGMGAARNGVAMLLASPPLSAAAMKTVPATAATAAIIALDAGKIFKEIHRIVGTIDENALHEFDGNLAEASKMLGIDLESDLIDPMGSEWSTYSTGRAITGGAMPIALSNFNIVNHLQDAAKLASTMAKLEVLANQKLEAQPQGGPEKGLSVHLKTAQINGIDVHYLVTGFISPSWGIDRGNLIVALEPRDVVAAANQAAGPQTSLLDNEAYAAIAKRLDAPQPNAVQFVDLPKTAPAAYQGMQQILGFLQIAHVVEIDPTVLPALDDILAQLDPAGSMAWTDAAGWHSRGISPFPGSELLGGQANIGGSLPTTSLMIAILIPSLGRAKELANRASGSASLHGITEACVLWAADHQGKYPAHLAQLVAAGMIAPKSLIDKSGNTQVLVLTPEMQEAMKKDWHAIRDAVDEHCDFVYVGAGMKDDSNSTVVVAYDKGMHKDGRNIAFKDVHVEWTANSQINERFEQSNKAAPNPFLMPLSGPGFGPTQIQDVPIAPAPAK